jgi:hypothetical protein
METICLKENGYKKIREQLRENNLKSNPDYSGWGIEIYSNENKVMIVDWDNDNLRIKDK